MRRSLLILCAVLLGLLALPGAALAKGAEAATIDGEALSSPIRVRGDGIPADSPPLWKIADQTGFWAAVGEQIPDLTSDTKPPGDLGPVFTITYEMSSPEGGEDDLVVQRIYPYAPKGPVTFTPAGQAVFDMKTVGGWFQADPQLKDMLVELGIPAKAPKVATGPATNTASTAASASSSMNWWLIASVTALAIAAGTAALWLRTRASIA